MAPGLKTFPIKKSQKMYNRAIIQGLLTSVVGRNYTLQAISNVKIYF